MNKPKLTVRQEVIQQLLLYYNNENRNLEEHIRMLKAECAELGHIIVPRNENIEEELKKDEWACTGAYCIICRESLGWWCPKSPDHLCHYSKSDDDCDYCHMPAERK